MHPPDQRRVTPRRDHRRGKVRRPARPTRGGAQGDRDGRTARSLLGRGAGGPRWFVLGGRLDDQPAAGTSRDQRSGASCALVDSPRQEDVEGERRLRRPGSEPVAVHRGTRARGAVRRSRRGAARAVRSPRRRRRPAWLRTRPSSSRATRMPSDPGGVLERLDERGRSTRPGSAPGARRSARPARARDAAGSARAAPTPTRGRRPAGCRPCSLGGSPTATSTIGPRPGRPWRSDVPVERRRGHPEPGGDVRERHALQPVRVGEADRGDIPRPAAATAAAEVHGGHRPRAPHRTRNALDPSP